MTCILTPLKEVKETYMKKMDMNKAKPFHRKKLVNKFILIITDKRVHPWIGIANVNYIIIT